MFNVKEKFSKILVGIDGSKPSMDAVDYAISLAQRVNAVLTVLYVESTPIDDDYTSDTPEDQIPEMVRDIVQKAKKESQPWFAEIAEKARSTASVTVKENTEETAGGIIQLKTHVIISPLSVVGKIVDYAEHENIDLIVVGTRGRSGFKKLLLGSIATGIVSHAHCPVMVVK